MSRGNRKEPIFEDTRDRQRFLEVIGEAHDRYELRPFAYCLMDNHYHGVVNTPRGNIASAMKHVNGTFTKWSNKRHRRTGHLLEGRYVAIVVEDLLYLRDLTRYVVLNPVKAHLVTDVADWPWSSYAATAGFVEPPSFLSIDWIDYVFGGPTRERAQQRYFEFVNQPDDGRVPNIDELPFGAGTFHGLPVVYPLATRPPLRRLLDQFMSSRRERNAAIRQAHFSFGYRMAEIASHLGLHASTVSKILRKR